MRLSHLSKCSGMVRACLAIYWVMAEGNESSSFSLPQPLSLKQILSNVKGCGVVKCIFPKNCDKPGRRLERYGQGRRRTNILCFLSQTLGITFLTFLQPSEDKLNFPLFPFQFGCILFMSLETLDLLGKGLTHKNGSRSCKTEIDQESCGSLAPEDLWHRGF